VTPVLGTYYDRKSLLRVANMVKVIVGMMGSSVAGGARSLATPSGVSDFLSVVRAHGVRELDTARVYTGGQSEETLGAVDAGESFAISTKAPAFAPGSLSESKIMKNCNHSLAALRQHKVDIYYLHGPDRQTPLEEQCRAIGQLYKEDKFERFGLSNISDQEVQTIYDICKREGYPLPKVYQGGFNPIGRGAEPTLIPLLRKLGMAFYAFSPLAGGLLAKKLDDVVNPAPGTRFDLMRIFGDMYLTPDIKAGLAQVQECCDKESIKLMEATMRWLMHHSVLGDEDGVVLGASNKEQIDATLAACEQGPLPESVMQSFVDLHEAIKDKLPGYHS
jgi:aflatoxin B1 aldehyde reductase